MHPDGWSTSTTKKEGLEHHVPGDDVFGFFRIPPTSFSGDDDPIDRFLSVSTMSDDGAGHIGSVAETLSVTGKGFAVVAAPRRIANGSLGVKGVGAAFGWGRLCKQIGPCWRKLHSLSQEALHAGAHRHVRQHVLEFVLSMV